MFPQPTTRILNDPVFRSIVYVPPADLQLLPHHRCGARPGASFGRLNRIDAILKIKEPDNTQSGSDHKQRRRARFDIVGLMGVGAALRIRVANDTTCRLRAADDSCVCWFGNGRDRPLFRLK
jgi:hypothetical protein